MLAVHLLNHLIHHPKLSSRKRQSPFTVTFPAGCWDTCKPSRESMGYHGNVPFDVGSVQRMEVVWLPCNIQPLSFIWSSIFHCPGNQATKQVGSLPALPTLALLNTQYTLTQIKGVGNFRVNLRFYPTFSTPESPVLSVHVFQGLHIPVYI